jgi:hypothetical protein
LGETLLYFNVNLLPKYGVIQFPETQSLSCAGVALDGSGPRPELWVGSPGDRTIARMDLWNGSVLQSFAPISGPFNLVYTNGNIFTLNQLVAPNMGVPYAFDAQNGRALIGESLGNPNGTTLTRGYAAHLFDDSKVSGRVYYIRPDDQLLHGFDAQHPSEADMTSLPLKVTRAAALARYKSCVIVMGRSNDEATQPQWSVYKVTDLGAWQLLRTSDYLRDTSINGALRMAVDSHGAVYIAHWKGVSRVDGLFEGLDCSN